MSVRQATVAVACACELGESATWSAREQALYWIDIRGPALHRLEPSRGTHRSWALPEIVGAVVPMSDGLLLALRRELARFYPATARLERICEIEPAALGNRLNEAKCDRVGRLWVGSMRDFAAATTGSLYRVDPDLHVHRVLRDVTVPNSLGWSPDGRTMLFADTAERVIRAYEYDDARGTLGATRALVAADALPGRPDGCTVDAEGHVWTTRVGAGLVARVAPDGRVVERVALPVSHPTSCALGGPELRTLFVTSLWQRFDAAQRRAQPLAGHLLAIEVDVPGLPDPEFAPAATAV